MNVLEHKKNPLLERDEVKINIEREKIPSRLDLTKEISKHFKKPEENIVIEKISGNFGNKTFFISLKIYDDVKSKEKYETITRKQRKKSLEERKKQVEEESKKPQEAEKIEEKE